MNRSTKSRLGLETLEVRENPTVNPSAAAGVLTITSDNFGDTVRVQSNFAGQVQVERMVFGSWVPLPPVYSGITKIKFIGNGGNDSFTNNTNLPLEADGGAGSDTITGGGAADTILGGANDDTLYGMGGNDNLNGQDGNDTIYGGFGEDSINGSVGHDKLYGDGNDDTMFGGDGNDQMWGGSGNDKLYGLAGNDKLYGQSGDDHLSDFLLSVIKYTGTNELYGGTGKDTLVGGLGADRLSGGHDGIADDLTGDFGADKFVRENYVSGLMLLNRDAPKDFTAAHGDTTVLPGPAGGPDWV